MKLFINPFFFIWKEKITKDRVGGVPDNLVLGGNTYQALHRIESNIGGSGLVTLISSGNKPTKDMLEYGTTSGIAELLYGLPTDITQLSMPMKFSTLQKMASSVYWIRLERNIGLQILEG